MSDNTKFEQLLDLLVNEEKEKAEELFHDIVVEKSKEIYQGLIESEEKEDEKEVEEATEESKDDEEVEESFGEEEAVEEVGGDATDDMMADVDAGDEMDKDYDDDGEMDDHETDHDDMEDRVVDLEDALDDLKAEFEAMMADKGGDEAPADDAEMDMGDEGEEESEEAEEESMEAVATDEIEEDAQPKTAGETMREYVEKVSAPKNSEGSDNTKSPVASKGGTEGGADGKNIAQGGEEKGGSAVKPKDMGKSFENEPGSKAGDTFKKASAPKSAE